MGSGRDISMNAFATYLGKYQFYLNLDGYVLHEPISTDLFFIN